METMVIGRTSSGGTIFVTEQDYNAIYARQGVKKVGEIVIREADVTLFDPDYTMPRPPDPQVVETEDDGSTSSPETVDDGSGDSVSGTQSSGADGVTTSSKDGGSGSTTTDRPAMDANVEPSPRRRRRVDPEDGQGNG